MTGVLEDFMPLVFVEIVKYPALNKIKVNWMSKNLSALQKSAGNILQVW